MMLNYAQQTDELYAVIHSLPRLNHLTPRQTLPASALYVFFERSERMPWRNIVVDRVVRVGAHTKNGNFPSRIYQHYGPDSSLGGNKNGSVFRKHVGGALLRRANSDDLRLVNWLKQNAPSFAEVEELVSRELRSNFTFTCIRVDDQDERLALESALIALLAQFPLGHRSEVWLGLHAASDKIRTVGLWNEHHIDALPLTHDQLRRLQHLGRYTFMGGAA